MSANTTPLDSSIAFTLRKIFRTALLGLVVIAAFVFSGTAYATTDTWSGATSSSWNTSGNWSTLPSTGDSLVFTSATGTGGTTLSDNLMTPGTYSIAGITFNSGAAAFIINPATSGTNGFTLTTGITNSSTSLETINDLITLGNATETITVGGGVTLGGTLSSAGSASGITLSGGGTLTLGGTGTNTINGTVTLTNTTGQVLALAASTNVAIGAITGGGTSGGTITLNTGSTLTINGTTASFISGGASGGGAISWQGTNTLTMNSASTFTGGLTIASGTVSTNNNAGLGAVNVSGTGGNTVTLGSGSNNATLTFTGNSTGGVAQNFIIAGSGTDTITSTATTGNSATLNNSTSGGGTFTLENNLIADDTSTGGLSFRAAISQSGGTYGITIGPSGANTGTVDFQGASTFSGPVLIDSGTAQATKTGSAGSVGAITSGPFGTGAVTLGQSGSSTAATLGLVQGNTSTVGISILNAITVASGTTGSGGRMIGALGALPATADVVSGPIALNADLTLTAVSATPGTPTGADRLDVGSGGITGSNNIIINNSNTATGAVANSGAIALYGGSSATSWTGNLIIEAGQGALGKSTAIGASNTLAVASGAFFNFSDNTTAFSPTVAGLDNATSGGAIGGLTGGQVLNNSGTNETLTLGGSGTYTYAGTITDGATKQTALTVALTGSGSQTLSGNNTYTGNTNINSGSLLLGTGGSLGSSTAVTVAGGATFGTAATNTSNMNVFSATSTATMTLNLGTTTSTQSNLQLNLFASSNDVINAGTLALTNATGSNTILLTLDNPTSATLSGAYTLLTWTGGTSLTTSEVTLAASDPSGSLSLSGDSLIFTIAAVPEPSTWALMIAGIALLGFYHQRRKLA